MHPIFRELRPPFQVHIKTGKGAEVWRARARCNSQLPRIWMEVAETKRHGLANDNKC